METLRAAYAMAKQNDGAPGVDGVTIEAQGAEALLEQLRDELTGHTYQPLPARRQEIPKDGGKVRVLSIPAIRDRVVQGALKLILEPVFEADFQPFGYRPKRTAQDAIKRVAEAIVQRKTRVLDFDLRAYFDNVRHDRLLAKVAQRVEDAEIMHLLKVMLKASGKKGVPQGGVISPLLSNLYLNEVDRMLERAREVTRNGRYTYIDYARRPAFAGALPQQTRVSSCTGSTQQSSPDGHLGPLEDLLAAILSDGSALDVTVTVLEGGLDVLLTGGPEPGLDARERLAAFAGSCDIARLSWRSGQSSPPAPVAARRPVFARFGGVAVAIEPGAFLQASAAGEAALVDAVLAGVGDSRTIADLFAGLGTFSFPLARNAAVHAVEGDASAFAALSAAARPLPNVTAARRDLFT